MPLESLYLAPRLTISCTPHHFALLCAPVSGRMKKITRFPCYRETGLDGFPVSRHLWCWVMWSPGNRETRCVYARNTLCNFVTLTPGKRSLGQFTLCGSRDTGKNESCIGLTLSPVATLSVVLSGAADQAATARRCLKPMQEKRNQVSRRTFLCASSWIPGENGGRCHPVRGY